MLVLLPKNTNLVLCKTMNFLLLPSVDVYSASRAYMCAFPSLFFFFFLSTPALFFSVLFFFEIESHVVQVSLKLSVPPRVTLNI